MKSLASVAALLLGISVATEAVAIECRDDPKIVEQCFNVHGRITVYANMRAYLWPVGTHRLLQFNYPEPAADYPYMPKKLFDLLSDDKVVYGDFEVCPFTPDVAGAVRYVCIQSASHLVIRDQDSFRTGR